MIDLDNIKTPADICLETAHKEKRLRKQFGYSQQELSERSGVSLGSLRRFEQTGEISFHSLVRLAAALECSNNFESLFDRQHFKSIEEVIKAQQNLEKAQLKHNTKKLSNTSHNTIKR